jgi:hypothetical protein
LPITVNPMNSTPSAISAPPPIVNLRHVGRDIAASPQSDL